MDPDPQGAPQDPASKPAWRGITDAGLKYAEARFQLLEIEAHEAVQTVAGAVVSGVVAAVLALGGWLLLVPALLWWLCRTQGWPVERTFVIAGVVHLFFALLFIRGMKNGLSKSRWFAESINQFKRDRAWIAQQTEKP